MNALRDKENISLLLKAINRVSGILDRPLRIMEVCGTHTMTLHKYGLRAQLEDSGVEMVSGPGCPVCITPDSLHEAAIGLVSRHEGMILATFGDITRVPTQRGSLQTAIPAPNSRLQVVYSPQEALEAARKNPDKDVVFFGVGFETTIPAIAYTIKQAAAEKLGNFSVLSAFWLIPPALKAILESGECALSGFLYPGHVSVIIGEGPYQFIPDKFGIPGAIAGFEPGDILLGILSVLDQVRKDAPRVANEYARFVRPEGNPTALALMAKMLTPKEAHWRGLGSIPKSGLKLKKKYAAFDAEIKYDLRGTGAKVRERSGCRCGEVLRGVIRPTDCRFFGTICSPVSPLGPCMVSFEGACFITYKYARPGR